MKIMFFFTHEEHEITNSHDIRPYGFSCDPKDKAIVIPSNDDRKMIYQYINFTTGWAEGCQMTIKEHANENDSLILFFHTTNSPNDIKDNIEKKIKNYNVVTIETFTSGEKELWEKLKIIKRICQGGTIATGKEERFGEEFDEIWRTPDMEAPKKKAHSLEKLLYGDQLLVLDILVQGYLIAVYLGKDDLQIEEVKNVFKALKETKGLRLPKELKEEVSEGKLAPSGLFRPLCMENGVVCDDSNGNASPKPFEALAECNYWFDSLLYEVYSDCSESLSGDPSFFTSTTDIEVQDLAKFLGPGNEADLLKAILGLNESQTAAGTLCLKLCSDNKQVYSGRVTGGAIRTIWELIRSGLNKEVASHNGSFSGDAVPIFESVGPLFREKWSGADNREDVIEVLFSQAFLEFRRAHELVTKAVARKKKLKKFREQRTKLNHSYLKNDFLSIFGPFKGPPYDVDSISQELLVPDRTRDKHNDAIKSWNKRIKHELLEFFNRDSFGPNIKPLESFGGLAEDCRKWIKALDRFVVKVWPGFFQLGTDAKKKEAASFFEAGINLYQAIQSLRVELDFFKYFSVSD